MSARAFAMPAFVCLLSLALVLVITGPATANWVDIAAGTLLEGGGRGAGIAWGDCDGDGMMDIYVSQYNLPSQLFHNEGGGIFSEMVGNDVNDAGGGTGAFWGDHDNDGQPDLYLLRLDEGNLLFENNGGCDFTDITSAPVNFNDEVWGGAWVDYDNDGLLDIFVTNHNGPNQLFRNEGGGVFNHVPGVLDFAGVSETAAWADYDNDGDQDLYLLNGTYEPNILYRNDGNGVFTDVTTSPLGSISGGQGAAWGDFDNDGDLDLYLNNWSPKNKLFRNDGNDQFTDMTPGVLLGKDYGQSCIWGDYDNDGDLDLYTTYYGLSNVMLENDGAGNFIDLSDQYPILADTLQSVGAAFADHDNDGDLDIYVTNFDGVNRLFENQADNGNHWLQVKLVGTLSNRLAIGARVRVVAGGNSWIREIEGSSSYLSQNSQVAHFGLGSAATIDSILVTWPRKDELGDFQTSVVTDVAVDQILTLIEPGSPLSAVTPAGPAPFVLHANHPNPFNPHTAIAFTLPDAARVDLRVYDMAGHLVRTLVAGEDRSAGNHQENWDGRGANGNVMPAGVYLYRLEVAGHAETRRMTLVK